MKNVRAIHLIDRIGKSRDLGNSLFETGEWANISDSRAERLVGAKLYLHRRKNEPSYLGGRILSYSTVGTGRQRRRIFTFRRMVLCFQQPTSPDGWSREQKTEYEEVPNG